MTSPKRIAFRACVRLLEQWFIRRQPLQTCHLSAQPIRHNNHIDLITIAFNNAQLLPLQEQFLRKNIRDSYTHIVVDNSTDPHTRQQIYQYCNQHHIPYLSLPHNPLNRIGGSYSHAAALNYAYRHIIQIRQPYAFGIIDHDLFPVQSVSVADKLLHQPVFGPLRHRGNCWYLSAIMSFFRYDFVQDKKVDFMPVKPDGIYLDSGGGNWYDLYSRLKLDELRFPDEAIEPLREGGDRHGDSLEYFDRKTWLHTINGSCWKPVADGKENLVIQLLNQYLKS